MSYDIAIIGAGPAGSTLARFLDRNYKVLLLDKRDLVDGHDEPMSKCCGGLLAPDAQQMLGRMGLAVPTEILVDPQLFLVRTIDFDNTLERFYQRFYFNMDRKKFDEWLVSLIPQNIDLAMKCRFTSLSEGREGYDIAFLYNNKIFTEKVRVLVGADGAMSNTRRQLFENEDKLNKYISIQEWLETDEVIPYYGAVFDSRITDFYSWTISKDKYLIIGSALKPAKDARQKFENLKLNLKDFGFRFGKPVKREGAWIVRPRKSDIITGNDRAALIGEAGCFISPSSAEGLSYAFKSAYELAASLNEGIDGFQMRYRKRIAGLANNIALKRLKSSIMYNKTLRSIIMKSGLLSCDIIDNADI
jgi:geranylgeranyl reductase